MITPILNHTERRLSKPKKYTYADTVEEAKQIAIDEVAENLQMVDSPVITSVVSSEVTSDVFIDDGGEPTSGMMMRNSQVVNYNNIIDCKEYDKRVGMCVLDNFMGVYGPLMKKLTREKLIAECRHFYKQHDPEPIRDNNGNIMLEDESDDEDDSKVWKPEHGISPQCLQYICEKYHISHYAYDITHQCFLKYVEKNNNYPALAYFCIS